MRVYLKDYPSHDPPTEITGVTINTCTKMIGGGGVLSFMVDDFENASIADLKEYLWERVEVKTNDEATTLWEGYINSINIDRSVATFSGIEGLRALDKIWAHHSSIIAQGAATAVGADSIDDTNRETVFPATVNGKYAIFTDIDQPSQETLYPSWADFYHGVGADDPANIETGAHTDLVPGVIGDMKILDTDTYVADGYGIRFAFEIPDRAASEKMVIIISLQMLAGTFYQGAAADYPIVELYDDNGAAWLSSDNADTSGVGHMPYSNWISPKRTFIEHTVEITDNLTNYINAGTDQIHLRVTCGDPNATEQKLEYCWVVIKWAKCINTFQATFEAYDVIYTIDAYDDDTLTFTGQTPTTDGVGPGDEYLVGDQLHTVMADIWKAAELSHFTLDFDSTTEVDAADYWYSYVGNILNDFASRLGRDVWQKIGWEIECKSATTDTAINLTDANVKRWTYDINGENMARNVLVRGGNNEVIVYCDPTYPTPYTLIKSDSQLHTEQSAKAYADQLKLNTRVPADYLSITVDYDEADYTALDLGKGIDVDLHSGVVTKAQGVIRKLSYNQNAGERLEVIIAID